MSGLEVGLAVAVVWLAGALGIVLAFEKYPRNEVAALVGWPVVLPVAGAIRLYLRLRYTCPDCPRRCTSRKEYEVHLRERYKCPGTPTPTAPTEGTA